ncbi:MAG: hypothetical protein AB8G77_25235 [Rhodothermales bacterium]
MKYKFFSSVVLLCVVATSAFAQSNPRPEDVTTLDGIITAYYEIVSGPAGSIPDKERDFAIHIPDSPVIIMTEDKDGNVVPNRMTISGFHERFSGPRETGFFEYEISRETQQYGAMTHIWSTYEWRATEDGPVGGRGINSIQLYHDGNRWWITSEIFDTRNKPVPAEYMPR